MRMLVLLKSAGSPPKRQQSLQLVCRKYPMMESLDCSRYRSWDQRRHLQNQTDSWIESCRYFLFGICFCTSMFGDDDHRINRWQYTTNVRKKSSIVRRIQCHHVTIFDETYVP
jgi:hypothetical protein